MKRTALPHVCAAACFGLLLLSFSFAVCAAEEQTPEQKAAAEFRKITTNLQFNRDGTVRLIRLSRPRITDEQLSPLKEFKQLDYLAVVCPQITDAGLAHIAGLTNLDTLLLSQSGIGDETLSHAKNLKKLERLYLANTKVTDAGLAHLQAAPSLRVLSLEGTQVTDAGLAHLAALPKLETLLLGDTAVTDQGLAHLKGIATLRVLFLTRTKVEGPGLEHLAALEKLEHLGLTETAVGNDDVIQLAALKQVKQIELYRSKLQGESVAELRAALPKTGVYVDRSQIVASQQETADNTSSEGTAVAALKEILPPITQRLQKTDETPDFQRHVIPLLGRLGCNGRACHGSFQGQGGFRLSMFGYDFDVDHENLSLRIDLDSPAESMILNKPTSADNHEGGLRLPPGGWEQDLLRRWIAAGGKNVAEKAPKFVRLEVTPAQIVFHKPGETAQIRAVAVWSDGTREDVTRLTRFQSNDDSVAEVTPDGLIKAKAKGDTYVISFYDNGIFSTQVLMPISKRTGDRYPQVAAPTEIDRHIISKLSKLGIVPAELCNDEEFLRRVSLDIIGTLPTPQEIETFVADKSPDKRAKKIDELLEHPAYVAWWTLQLCDLTGSNAGYLGSTDMNQTAAAQWRSWIERRVRENVGWDEIVRGIVLASSRRPGQTYRDYIAEQSSYTERGGDADSAAPGNVMPYYWFRSNVGQPSEKALAFGYTFLGVRLQCAQCHKHPFDQWSKQDFEQFTQFFTRIKTGAAPDATAMRKEVCEMLGVPKKLDTAALRRQSYMRIAAEGRPIPWFELYIEAPGSKPQPAKLLGGDPLDLNQYEDPREPLMQWLLTEPNRYFAKAFVNRMWANYFNVGIIDPPDDLNLANPPSNKQLLDYLVDQFVARGYDIKWLHREIVMSHAYQRSWRPNDTNRNDERNFSRAVVRRLPAEVTIDAIVQATAGDAKLAQLPTDMKSRKISNHPTSYQARAIDYSLLIFGKPLRTTNCDCERQSEPTLLQALYVRNDEELLGHLDRSDGWIKQITKLAEPNRPAEDDLIRSAYLRTLSRQPTSEELADCRQHLAEAENPIDGLRDVLWALLNTQEFITNH